MITQEQGLVNLVLYLKCLDQKKILQTDINLSSLNNCGSCVKFYWIGIKTLKTFNRKTYLNSLGSHRKKLWTDILQKWGGGVTIKAI